MDLGLLRGPRWIFALVLLSLGVTLALGYTAKTACMEGNLNRWYCYSDITPLFAGEGMDTRRLPFLDPCPPQEALCDEYPVVQMWLLRGAGTMSRTAEGFLSVNAAMLSIAALLTTLALWRLVGRRALYFTAAPALVIYGFLNWDLYPVAIAVLAVAAFMSRRDRAAGALVGLGVATKLFPGLLLLPFVADRLHSGEHGRARTLVLSAGLIWMAINAPFAILAWDGWSTFFHFNAARAPEWSTPWFIGCISVARFLCLRVQTINALSGILFIGSLGLVWWCRRRIAPDFRRWTLVFPSIALFLVTTKVYSPQYSLWLVPFFALVFPRLTYFIAFSLIDTVVSAFFFTWALVGDQPWEVGYQVAGVARTLMLIACVVIWTREGAEDPLPGFPSELSSEATAGPVSPGQKLRGWDSNPQPTD